MAYSNRDWDRGKDNWSDRGSWNDYNANKGSRSRDDDYQAFGEGKRRKYNDGVGHPSHGLASGQFGHYGLQGYDAPHGFNDSAQSSAYGHGGQDKGFKKRLVPSEPSPHVIFLGLDPDFNEADLQAFLSSHGCSIETVTIIRDKSTGVSKGFGFAQFTSTEHARAFVGPLFPFIQVPPPASHGASATHAFYKALETGTPHSGRRVKIDYSQSATPHDKGRRQNLNDGTRDIGNSQAPVLLFRGLDPLSGPQAILQSMRGSSGPGKEGAKGMKRIIVIKDKVTLASFGFAFVEFVDIQSASAVLAATMSPKIHPSGFRISDKPVAASFAHPYSFQPVTEFLQRDEACVPSSVSLGGTDGSWVRYWDESSTVAVLEFKVEEPAPAPAPASTKEKKEKKKKNADSEAQSAAALAEEATIIPASDKPVTMSFSRTFTTKSAAGGPTKPSNPAALGFGDDLFEGADDVADPTLAEDGKAAAAKKVVTSIVSKKVANNITKWNQVQEELKDDTVSPAVTPASATGQKPSGPVQPATATPATDSGQSPPQEAEFEFSDTTAMTCLLCARQFKSQDQLKRHNKESDLHKKNFKDANLREVARQKIDAARKAASTDQPKYRDRASERRIMHNQPEVPVPTPSENDKSGKKRGDGSAVPSSPPVLNPGEDQSNVGNKLLKMMGWTEGSGLGTEGEGRVEPIQTAIYAQGVGLGASKGREVGKFAEGYSGYVDIAKDAARQRYNT